MGGTDAPDSEEGQLKACDKLAEVKPNVRLWDRDEAQFEQALKSGEIPMGQYYHDVTGLAAADGHPVRSTFPKEGGILDRGSWALSRAPENPEEAPVFIDYLSQPPLPATRPEERRGATEGGRTCTSQRPPHHHKQTTTPT